MEEYLKILSSLFTPAQQSALAIITIGVMSLLQVFKNIYFGFWPERSRLRKTAIIWMFGFTIGIAAGIAGYYLQLTKQPLWFWIFTGITSGVLAIGSFKLLIEIIWPRLKAVVKKPA